MRDRGAADALGLVLVTPAVLGLASLSLANAMLLSTWEDGPVELPLDSARYQRALDERLATSSLRDKAAIEAVIDMGASFR